MSGSSNLIPQAHKLTVEEQSAGGTKSAEVRRRRKAFAEAFEVLLSREITDRNGNKAEGIAALAARTFQQALYGDMRAVQFIRDTVGEMPVQRVEVDTIDPQARAEMDELLGL